MPNIRATWTNLIEQLHRKGLEDDSNAPWELIAYNVENIARRVDLSESVCPIGLLFQLLLQYDIEHYTHDSRVNPNSNLLPSNNFTWVVDLFVKIGAPFEALVGTLENIWYSQEHPFVGRTRKLVIKWIIYTVEQ